MNTKLIYAVLLFGLFGLIYGTVLAVQDATAEPVGQVYPIPTHMPETMSQTMLWFKQDVSKIDDSGKIPVDVFINTKENKVTMVKLGISYDPKALQVISVKNEDLLSGKQVDLQNVDAKNGIISLEVRNPVQGNIPPIQGADRIAEIVFVPLNPMLDSTILKFLPETKVDAYGIKRSALVQTQDLEIRAKR